MGYDPENSPPELPNLSGRSLAQHRQVYELAKKGAPNFSFDTIPAELLARFRAEENSSVESELPTPPELTGEPLTDAGLQFDLGRDELVRFAADSDLDETELARKLLAIANSMGGELSPDGKRQWVFSRLTDGYTLDEIAVEVEELKDSPST